MKRIFRSIIDIPREGKPTIEQEELIRNYRAFLASTVQPEDPSYIKLYHWIEAHYRDYKEIPSLQLLFKRAEKDGEETVLATLKDIITETPFIRSNYLELLKEKFEEQSKHKLQSVLTRTWEVANTGLKVGKKEIKGLSSAVEYFLGESRNFRMVNMNTKTEGNVRSKEDCTEVLEAYKKHKKDPSVNIGMYQLLDRIDDTCRGIKPGDLMIIAAFVAQGKTMLTTNFVYNGIMQGMNGLFVCMEMNFQEMRDWFYVLHCNSPEWFDDAKYKKYKNLAGKISYDKVRYGELSDLEHEFFTLVSNDFSSRQDFGNLFLYQPTEGLTPSKLEQIAYDYNSRLQDMGQSLDFLAVDYVGLMIPDKSEKYGDWNIDLNNIIKKLKNMAINFDNGRGLRVVTPFQVNRQGYKDAQKNDGIYGLAALSNANEAERSSDLIISTYMTREMQTSGIIKIGCLKHRRGALFDAFEASINFQNKQIRDFIQSKKTEDGNDPSIKNIAMDVV
jgi:replicative DNA helicase